jgi:hypothetical protein
MSEKILLPTVAGILQTIENLIKKGDFVSMDYEVAKKLLLVDDLLEIFEKNEKIKAR